MVIATPSGDFTNWCRSDLITAVRKKADPLTSIRKRKLGAWIDAKFEGNQTAAARKAGKPASQISELVQEENNRSFGGKLARELEKSLRMPDYYLDIDDTAIPASVAASDEPWPFTRFTWEQFDNLDDIQKLKIEYWVEGCIAGFTERASPMRAKKTR